LTTTLHEWNYAFFNEGAIRIYHKINSNCYLYSNIYNKYYKKRRKKNNIANIFKDESIIN